MWRGLKITPYPYEYSNNGEHLCILKILVIEALILTTAPLSEYCKRICPPIFTNWHENTHSHKLESANTDKTPLRELAKYVSYLDTSFTHMSIVSYYKIFYLVYRILLKV